MTMTVTERDLITLFRGGTAAELNDAIAQLKKDHGERESERIYDRALKAYDRETERQDNLTANNTTLATLLAGAESNCDRCEGVGRLYSFDLGEEIDCGPCDGCGRILTADGQALMAFVERHLMKGRD